MSTDKAKAEERARALIARATHDKTPNEEARTCAHTALQILVKYQIPFKIGDAAGTINNDDAMAWKTRYATEHTRAYEADQRAKRAEARAESAEGVAKAAQARAHEAEARARAAEARAEQTAAREAPKPEPETNTARETQAPKPEPETNTARETREAEMPRSETRARTSKRGARSSSARSGSAHGGPWAGPAPEQCPNDRNKGPETAEGSASVTDERAAREKAEERGYRFFASRYKGVCPWCHEPYKAGDVIGWKKKGATYHEKCCFAWCMANNKAHAA